MSENSKLVTVVALHTVHHNPTGKKVEVELPGGKPFKMLESHYKDLGPKDEGGLGAVRRATKKDTAEDGFADDDSAGSTGGSSGVSQSSAPEDGLTVKHNGGGRWIVIDDKGAKVSGDEPFSSKDAAEAWLTEHRSNVAGGAKNDDLLG